MSDAARVAASAAGPLPDDAGVRRVRSLTHFFTARHALAGLDESLKLKINRSAINMAQKMTIANPRSVSDIPIQCGRFQAISPGMTTRTRDPNRSSLNIRFMRKYVCC